MAQFYLFCLFVFALRVGAQETTYKKPEIYSLNIYSDIKYRFATTKVTSRVKNPDTESREAIFDVTLPNEAFITNLTLDIDGKIIVGEIKRKAEAKAQYVAAQQRGESAGYIETKHRETNRFNLAITAAPKSKVAFNLTYQELLQRKHGYYEQVIYIDPGQPVPEMDVTVSILESRNITSLSVPPLRNDIGTDLIALDTITVIQRPTPKSAYVKFVPSVEQQLAQTESGMAGQFVVRYDVDRNMDAGDIMIVNGYFVHFFAPEGLEPIPNDVLFILDRSGSMHGTKLAQVKEAMKSILEVLNEGDRINILTFASTTSFWRFEMQDTADEDVVEEAKTFVESVVAQGGTNINEALLEGIQFLRTLGDNDPDIRSPVIVFLTDGQATSGETWNEKILTNIRDANKEANIPIFSLAFGANADYDLVKKIAVQNNGFGRRIYEASDAAMQIAGLYSEISLTLLKNLTFNYLDAPVSNLTRHHYENYFSGSEVVVAGKIDNFDPLDTNTNLLKMHVSSNSFEGPSVLVLTNQFEPGFQDAENLTHLGDYEKITEKVWAYLTIKQLLEQELATSDQREKLEYNKRILELSLMYGFVSPLTSMVVTKDTNADAEEVEPIALFTDEVADTVGPKSMSGSYIRKTAFAKQSAYMPQSGGSMHHPIAPQSLPGHAARKFFYPFGRIGPIAPQSLPGHASRYVMKSSPRTGPSKPKDFADSPPAGRSNRKKNRRPNIPHQRKADRSKIKKAGKKAKGKRKAFKAPLMVELQSVDTPLCFRMYMDEVKDGEEYLLYADTANDVRITAQVATTRFRRTKLQSSIKTVVDFSSNSSARAVSYNETHVEVDSPKNGSTTSTDYVIDAGAFRLIITSMGDNSLGLFVDSVNAKQMSNEGILGSILSKKIKMKLRKGHATPTKKKKQMALLKVDKTTVKAILLHSQPAYGKGQGESSCWLMRKESVFYDMPSYKHTV